MFKNICDIYNINNINIIMKHNNIIQKNGYKQSDVVCEKILLIQKILKV